MTTVLGIVLLSGANSGISAHAADAEIESRARDVAREESNRALVVEFYTTVLSRRQLDKAPKYLKENYIQHNPFAATGREAFLAQENGQATTPP